MQKTHFSIDIKASPERVWDVLWEEESFREWTSTFTEESKGSYIKSGWQEGGRFEFYEGDTGSYGIIEKLVPSERISFNHMGELREGKEYPFDDGPRLEEYTLEENGGITTLILEHHIPEEYREFFEETTPRAFERIKELAEK